MVEIDPLTTQRDPVPGIAAELAAAGFEDVREIGRGGFGVVYRCLQRSLERTVAVKVLTSDLDPDNLERFLREQRAMGKLSGHPHIVSIFQVGATTSGRPYIVMQYHPGGSLDARIHEVGPIIWQDAVHIGLQVAGALETAHRLGTVHRDVKPANILLTEYGEPQLADFGIARIAGGFETTTGIVTGSPAFTAPEVLQGQNPTPSSDIYSLGATLFCAITGHAVFERHSGEQVVAQFLRITKHPIPDLRDAGIPADVSAAIERAMARDPAARPAAAADFGEQLRLVQERHGLPVDELPVPLTSGANSGGQHGGSAVTTGSSRRTGPRGYSVPMWTPPAPATRFRPPPPTRALVTRGRLIDTLRAGQRRRLTIIHAPPGFGKSTLAAQWGEVLTEEGVAVAWLTVDHDDNNAVWFLVHLIEAIRRVRPALAHELGDALEEHGDEAERYVLTSLINEIHERGERVAIVIDDWHRVTDAATIAAMGFLLDNGCHHLQVVVTSRTHTGLPLSRMRVRDDLVEIDSTALRFNADESQNFLVDLGGLELERGDVEDLTESTDGWVAALQLASLSLRGHDDPTLLIGHLSGRHHAIGEFLAENVLEALEPHMLDFLLATSVTERICGDLASALTSRPRGQARLEEVEERDLFLRRVDDDGQWFRYHPVFVEFLRQRLERDQPERIAELHRIATEWYADHRFVSEAVDHALAAGDQQRAVEIVERDGTYLLEHSQMATLLGLVGKLPPQMVVSTPRLQLTVAWANILLHRAQPAKRALHLVDTTLDRSSLTDTTIADIRLEADVVRGVVQLRADTTEGIDVLVAPCFSRPDTLRPWVVSVAANIATFAAIYRSDFDEAVRLQDWAFNYHQRNRGTYNLLTGHCWMGIAANQHLDIAAAEQTFRHALTVAKLSGGSHSYTARLAGSLLGELLYERGEVAEAERLLDEGYKLGPEGGSVDFKLARYVVGARIKALRGDRDAAARRLNEGLQIAEAMSLPRLRAATENERIRLGLPVHPDLGALPHVSYSARRRPVDGIDEITAQLEEDTAIRLLLCEEDIPARTELACIWSREWVDTLEGRGRPRALLQARRLLAACLSAAGRLDEAKAVLAPVAAQCAALGTIRYLADGGPYVVSVLAALREDQLAGRWRPEWPPVPASFLIEVVAPGAVQII
ncbi:serine/threonine-protein kinase [Rhodococcus opacus]|uniref:serine/threonine-protein kinase n=1 Tax=Rhodococcus opacus TaxID=37919 RepID=UPI0002F6AE13|nr:serine/threonine-protein kinase [Rhodococcus opacus]AHK35887.1 Serine/threonine-protein kinase pknK [Rhodococcus opacus PD630]UDH01380.1 protein kinase [Rhodococcus opacus PD630]